MEKEHLITSGEKHYEQLSAEEKKIYDTCGAIIAYDRGDLMDPEILKLRERATRLFEKMRKVDFSYHDDYYKLLEEANTLDKELERIKEKDKEKYKYIELNIDEQNIAEKMISELGGFQGINLWFDWVHNTYEFEDQADEFYNDRTGIQITRGGENKFELIFNEIFNPNKFSSPSHISTFNEKVKMANYNFHVHDHGERPNIIKEFTLIISDLTINEVKSTIDVFVDVIKANPRKS